MNQLVAAPSGPFRTRSQTPEDRLRLTPAPALVPGDLVPGLSSWVLERKIGCGGFGEVWLARHAFDDEQELRAVKFCTDPTARRRLVAHERNVVVRVMRGAGKHPNIVPLRDCNLDGAAPWLMFEFVRGGTLADRIERWRPLAPAERARRAVPVLAALAGALAACHRLAPALVHRDLKPHNVLMAGDVPRITDFGIGGVIPGPPALCGTSAPPPPCGAGTRLYAPPEQLLGAPPDPRDDVYALGVIAYQAVTGDLRAGPGTDVARELHALGVAEGLVRLIVRSTALDPDRRPRDAGEWERHLDHITGPPLTPPSPAEPEPFTPRARRPWLARAVEATGRAVAATLTACFLVYFALTNRGPEAGAEG